MRCTSALLVTLLFVLAIAEPVSSDTITLRGTTIAIPCTIDRIEAGRLVYVDSSGRTQRLALDGVEAIGFDGLELLDDAHMALRKDEYRDALRFFMKALLDAATPTQKIWIHAQLAQTHDFVGEYVQAAGHLAAVTLIEPHGYWRSIAPISEVNEPSFAAAEEAISLLRQAMRQVTHPQLSNTLSELHRAIEPVHRRLHDRYDGPTIEAGSTISGIAKSALRADAEPMVEQANAEQVSVPAADESDSESAPPLIVDPPPLPEDVSDEAGRPNPANLESMLQQERFAEAVAACERIAVNPGRRDLAEFLHQYGRALNGVNRPRDASVMFMRCAILFRGSPQASLSLVETALIYRDTFNNSATVLRLLQRAEAEEVGHDRQAVLTRIRELRSSLGTP